MRTLRLLLASLIVLALIGTQSLAEALKSLPLQLTTPDNQSSVFSVPATTNRSAAQNTELSHTVAAASPAVVSIIGSKDMSPSDIRDFLLQTLFNDPDNEQMNHYNNQAFYQTLGTGFFINSNGLIITNNHVVADPLARYTVVLEDGKERRGQVVYRDPEHDLALVQISGSNYPTLPLQTTEPPKRGQTVVAIANPYQRQGIASSGSVRALNQTITAEGGETQKLSGLIQTSTALMPGDSGGPLLNEHGQVVGVNVARAVGRTISFAIPATTVAQLITENRIN